MLPENAGVISPFHPTPSPREGGGYIVTSDFGPRYGDPQNAWGHYPQLLGKEKAGFVVATLDFVCFFGDPPEHKGCVPIPPNSGLPKRQGLCSHV